MGRRTTTGQRPVRAMLAGARPMGVASACTPAQRELCREANSPFSPPIGLAG
jgi:hypothetical protein